ncbi:GNAT family N-acetyltransferase [Flavobacterium sp. Arc2]|uniref:GNAT family N-acetyltransferase n=1 Tax=Flavobacterium sp. Arc2 TaxID=3046685 RepID=UPI00352C2574
MSSTFSFQIYSSVKNIPSSWDSLAVTNIFLSRDYLEILAISAPKNMHCHFIGMFQNEELVGIAVTQYIDLSKLNSFGERDHCLKTIVRDFVFKNLSSNVLVLGNNMLTGQNGCYFSQKLPASEGLALLKKATDELKKIFRANGTKIHLTIFKDFAEERVQYFKIPEFNSFFQFTTQPNMIFDIRNSWSNFDDYIADLSKKYRDQYKRARKKAEGISKRKLSLEEITTYNSRIYELYMNVAKNAPFNTFYLTENHFKTLKTALKDKFLFYGYFVGDELIGFNTLIKNGKDIDTYFLGYDEVYQREKMLYLNMLYDMIGFSINKGYSRIIFARTALEIKSSVGAQPMDMFGMMQHSNSFINLFVSKTFSYFEPKMEWKERNPFK